MYSNEKRRLGDQSPFYDLFYSLENSFVFRKSGYLCCKFLSDETFTVKEYIENYPYSFLYFTIKAP